VPIVASYCTTFLKPEMLHIYRQVTGLQKYSTFVVTKERQNDEEFPFPDVELIPKARKNFIKRFYLKYIRRLPPVYYRGELQVLIKIFKRRPADLMHVYFGHTGVHLLPFIKEWERPSIVSFHGADVMPRPEQEDYDAQLRELLQTATLILARSASLVRKLEELGCPPGKIRLNRTGIPLESFPFKARPLPADGSWRFVQACRLIPKKGLATALRAFARFHKDNTGSRFVIAGDGPMRGEVEEMARALGIGDAVELPGFLSQGALRELYEHSQIFLHPSETPEDQNQEGVPNSMLEAMSTGLPVLATRHGGIPEAVAEEKSGFLVPERDHEALHRAMCRMTESAEYLYIMGQAASQSVREEFERSRQIARLESYYDEALALFEAAKKPA
jgi:colanic acid/amylovoran biosynthesis glycosyltransferase